MITYKKKQREHNVLQETLKWCVDIVVLVCIVYMMVIHLGDRVTVVGHSMEGVLLNGDKVLINKFEYKISSPKRFDIIVFKNDNKEAALDYYVKRIIGLPGERIKIEEGKVYINGEELKDDVVKDSIYNSGIARDEIALGNNEYFVLGDNRNNSEDSRLEIIGTVRREQIEGKVWLIVSPVERMELVK